MLVELRRAFPSAYIGWLAATPFAPLLRGHPLISEVLPFDRARYGRIWRDPRAGRDFARLVADLRRRRFDLVLDLQGLFRSGYLAWASGAPVRIGFADGREFAPLFLTQAVAAPPAARHAVDRNLELLRALGLHVGQPEFPLALTAAELSGARALLGDIAAAGRSFVAVLPGARWTTKLWRPQRWAAVIDHLHAAGLPVVLLGAASEQPMVREIEVYLRSRPLSLVGRTSLRELTAVLALAESVLCQDSGPMHLAAALGRPVVALFGPTDPARCGPCYAPAHAAPAARPGVLPLAVRPAVRRAPSNGAAVVLQADLPCAACYRRSCWHHSCMQRITPDDVLAARRDLLASAVSSRSANLRDAS